MTDREPMICQVLMTFLRTLPLPFGSKRRFVLLVPDPVDAAHDSEILARLLEDRCDRILSGS